MKRKGKELVLLLAHMWEVIMATRTQVNIAQTPIVVKVAEVVTTFFLSLLPAQPRAPVRAEAVVNNAAPTIQVQEQARADQPDQIAVQ